MRFQTVEEYEKEIARVQAAMDKTDSEFLRRDYGKYMKRLQKEMRGVQSGKNRTNRRGRA